MIERSFRDRYVQIRRHFLHVIFKKTFPVRKSLFHNDLRRACPRVLLADEEETSVVRERFGLQDTFAGA